VVNALIWLQDIATGGGVEYAYWITIPWGIGLTIHATAYSFSRGRAGAHPKGLSEDEESEEPLPHY
jgi:hypothetical protein